MDGLLLDVRGLRKFFPIRRGVLRRLAGHVRAVDDVSFELRRGETLSLVGESGCGKTTTARCILRAITPTAGEIRFRTAAGSVVDVATLPKRRLRPLRREMQMIFQDPFSSLNPRKTLHDIVGEPLLVNGVGNRHERSERVAELLRLVGLRPEYMRRFPHAFSGGQRQRIGIARALALNPSLVVADEPVSALDVSVQAQILNLMLDLQAELGLTYLFVAHDLSVVKHVSDRVAVMYVGRIVEVADTDAALHDAAPPVHGGAPVRGPEARPAAPDPAHRAGGRRGGSGQPAAGLLLPSPLRVRGGAVPDGDAAPRGDRARAHRRLPPGARARSSRRRSVVAAGRAALGTGLRVLHPGARPPGRPDAAALADLARASRRLHRPWVYPPETTRAVARWLGAAGPRRLRLLVCRREDGAIVGVVNLNEIVRGAFHSAYLGYYGFAPHAGQGYMAEGLGLVLRHAFRGSASTAWRRTSSRATAPRARSCGGSGSGARVSRPAT